LIFIGFLKLHSLCNLLFATHKKGEIMIRKVLFAGFFFSLELQATPIPKITVDAQQLLKAIAYDESGDAPNIYDWKLTESSQTMIAWDPEGNKWNGEGYERSGKVVLSNKGKLTHHEVDSSVKPGYWKLKFFAQKSHISRAILEPSGITQENPHVDFDIVTIQEKVVCQNTSEQKETGYRIKFPGKRFFWIDENTKISSRGSGSTYTISFDQKPTCVIKAERRAAEARRLEAQKRAEEDKIKKAKEELELLRLKQEKLEAIRKAKEALKQQELLEIEQVKNELEGLLDQKVNLESMAGAQAALNYQQRLQLLKDKIALIKYQKVMAKKINGVKGEIEVLTKELTQTEETLTQLKKSKKDQDQLQYMQQRAKIKRRLLDQARQLLGSYQSESSLRQTREKLNARIAMKDTSSGTYVVKQKRYTPKDLEEQKKKYQELQKKVQEKIVKIQTDIQTIEKEITETKAHPSADQNNTGDSTVALKEDLLQQAKKLLESYKKEKEENTQVIGQIEDKIKELREKHERAVVSSNADTPIVSQSQENIKQQASTDLGSFLTSFVAAGNSDKLPSDALNYYAHTVRPYFKTRYATRKMIFAFLMAVI